MRTPKELADCIDVAMRRRPADCVIRNVRRFDLVTGELQQVDIALSGKWIAAVGEGYEGEHTIDGTGLTAVPGFVDAHCHIESSLLTPYEYERAALPHGTVAAVCDPHELANVCGVAAIEMFRACAEGMLMHLEVHVPSCVPALPTEETGAALDADAIRPYASKADLSEFMNVPGVLNKDADVLDKLSTYSAGLIDGHAPLVSGDALNALCAVGIANDHETSNLQEALEKLRCGMTLFLRAGSVGRDLPNLLPLLTLTHAGHICLCTDDRDPIELSHLGSMDDAIRIAIQGGCDPLAVYRAAALTPAQHFGWRHRGLVAPGYEANIVLVSDLAQCTVEQVICKGILVNEDAFAQRHPAPSVAPFLHSIHCAELQPQDLLPPEHPQTVIGITEGSLLTQALPYTPDMEDVATVCLIARYGKSNRIGRGLVKGFGLTHGALASSVGHDSHNLCVVGCSADACALAANALRDCGGGFVVVADGEVKARLPLPVGGLMSDEPYEVVAEQLQTLRDAVTALGVTLSTPFPTLSFLPLPVIPFARITLDGVVTL